MCIEGIWETVYVDDWFPATATGAVEYVQEKSRERRSDGKVYIVTRNVPRGVTGKKAYRFAFAHTDEAELWPCVLEKVWAKIFHSYKAVEGGLIRDSFKALTGAPTRSFQMDDPEAWKEL